MIFSTRPTNNVMFKLLGSNISKQRSLLRGWHFAESAKIFSLNTIFTQDNRNIQNWKKKSFSKGDNDICVYFLFCFVLFYFPLPFSLVILMTVIRGMDNVTSTDSNICIKGWNLIVVSFEPFLLYSKWKYYFTPRKKILFSSIKWNILININR